MSKNLVNINKKSFISVVIILGTLMLFTCLLTYFIPRGMFLRNADGTIIPGTFYYDKTLSPYPIYKLILSPFLVLVSEDSLKVIVISLFLLILGGSFTLMNALGGISALIHRIIKKFEHNHKPLICIVTLFFMLLGSLFGIFEEGIVLLPVIIILTLTIGYDTFLGLILCVLSIGFGFSAAITNPFTIGLASEIADTNIMVGIVFRIILFIILYAIVATFAIMYAKKIKKNPEKSYTYEVDQVKKSNGNIQLEFIENSKLFRIYTCFFAFILIVIFTCSLVSALTDYTIVFLALSFLFGSFISGYLASNDIKKVTKIFGQGVLSLLPAVLMILMASSIKLIISEGHILDTILFRTSDFLKDSKPIAGVLLIYCLVLVMEFFIGSSTAKALLILPIIIPICTLINIQKEVAILAFVFADGFANILFPTSPVLLIGLSMGEMSYTKWVKGTYKIQIAAFILSILALVLATKII